jgi:hypothetical protein
MAREPCDAGGAPAEAPRAPRAARTRRTSRRMSGTAVALALGWEDDCGPPPDDRPKRRRSCAPVELLASPPAPELRRTLALVAAAAGAPLAAAALAGPDGRRRVFAAPPGPGTGGWAAAEWAAGGWADAAGLAGDLWALAAQSEPECEPLVILDARADPRSCDLPSLCAARVAFVLCVPLRAPDGRRLGAM